MSKNPQKRAASLTASKPGSTGPTSRGTTPLVALRGVGMGFGGRPLFTGLSLAVSRGDRSCLVGRNGSGKSTLLKLLAGVMEPDQGERFVQPGARIIYLPQEPVLDPTQTVAEHIAEGLAADPHAEGAGPEDYRVQWVLEPLGIEGAAKLGTLSGGGRRRAAIGRALVAAPDVLLLDEPTNHLDLPTITWLESELSRFAGGMLMISHDRTFLTALTARTCWLDRGRLHETGRGFAAFEQWSEEVLNAEEKEITRQETQIAQEMRYMHRGVTARRRRNQGRVAKLASLRQAKAERLRPTGRVKAAVTESEQGGRLVIEAEHLHKHYGERCIIKDFSTRLQRGDRVGIIGPNGAGKSTLLKMLTGVLAPDSGVLRLGTGLELAYFDQNRASLDPDETPWGYLCERGGDMLDVGGEMRHVVSYLRDFLFEDRQAKARISTLSGGERNRLVLAKLFARPSNLLVLDEPTNDLDMDTLDLLEELLADYAGTLLLVSHDRDFLDRLVTSIIAVEGEGKAEEYPGGYSDYLAQRQPRTAPDTASPASPTKGQKGDGSGKTPAAAPSRSQTKLSYKEQRELDQLPERIEALGTEIATLEAKLADPDLFAKDPKAFETASTRLPEAQAERDQAEERWLELEEKREALEAGR